MKTVHVIQRLLRSVGIDARRYGVQRSPDAQLGRILHHLKADLVLDVGAYDGAYGRRLRAAGYRGRIVSFEPLPIPYERLVRHSRRNPPWEVAPRIALGSANGETVLHVSGHPMSSSIRQMLPLHEQSVPGSGTVRSERVPLARLDRLAPAYLRNAQNIILKMDTQGYEDEVLRGAQGVLDRILAIQIELSLVSLYAGQRLYDEMRTMVEALGFDLFAIFPGHVWEATGQTLQVDGFFVRRGQ